MVPSTYIPLVDTPQTEGSKDIREAGELTFSHYFPI